VPSPIPRPPAETGMIGSVPPADDIREHRRKPCLQGREAQHTTDAVPVGNARNNGARLVPSVARRPIRIRTLDPIHCAVHDSARLSRDRIHRVQRNPWRAGRRFPRARTRERTAGYRREPHATSSEANKIANDLVSPSRTNPPGQIPNMPAGEMRPPASPLFPRCDGQCAL
jgi:hypothetical protein